MRRQGRVSRANINGEARPYVVAAMNQEMKCLVRAVPERYTVTLSLHMAEGVGTGVGCCPAKAWVQDRP